MLKTIMTSMLVMMLGTTGLVYAQESGSADKIQIEANTKKKSVKFERKELVPGERRIKSDTMELDIKIEAHPPEGAPELLHQRVTEVMVCDEKVLVGKPDYQKYEVRFRTVSKSEERTNQGKTDVRKENSPVEGKTYLVTWTKTEGLSVTTGEGGVVPEEEASVVLKEYRSLGTASSFARFIDGKTVVVGERLDMSPEAMAAFLKDNDDGAKQVAKGSVLLKELRKVGKYEVAVFDFQIDMTRSEGQSPNWMEMIVNLAGEVLVRVDGVRMLEMKMDGPVKFKGESMGPTGVKVKMQGKGAMRGKGAKTYL